MIVQTKVKSAQEWFLACDYDGQAWHVRVINDGTKPNFARWREHCEQTIVDPALRQEVIQAMS